MRLQTRAGRQSGKRGILVLLKDKNKSVSFTVHDITLSELHSKILFYLQALENGKYEVCLEKKCDN
jgi:hypothetical protein